MKEPKYRIEIRLNIFALIMFCLTLILIGICIEPILYLNKRIVYPVSEKRIIALIIFTLLALRIIFRFSNKIESKSDS